jgi:hypothetical protein
LLERCDFIDMLEESVRLHRPVSVELKAGKTFTDEASDVTDGAEGDWAYFRLHERVPLGEISSCRLAVPPEPSYRGKPVRAHPHPGEE